jgi:Ca2+-binding EF-hand superfamily protein
LNVDRLFFEFDKKQEALLEFFEFAYMIEFLKINANKNQIRTLFDIIDINKKNEVTL